jgi:hypothetical protein
MANCRVPFSSDLRLDHKNVIEVVLDLFRDGSAWRFLVTRDLRGDGPHAGYLSDTAPGRLVLRISDFLRLSSSRRLQRYPSRRISYWVTRVRMNSSSGGFPQAKADRSWALPNGSITQSTTAGLVASGGLVEGRRPSQRICNPREKAVTIAVCDRRGWFLGECEIVGGDHPVPADWPRRITHLVEIVKQCFRSGFEKRPWPSTRLGAINKAARLS